METSEDAPAPQPVKLSLPLAFQQSLFQSLRAQDSLTILARGLGLPRILTNLLHSYDASGNNLILILGLTPTQSHRLARALIEAKVTSSAEKARGLTIITAKDTPRTRYELYAQGGIFSVTARVLIGDVLSGVVDVPKITGVVAVRAERFTATSNEAFILRVYREKNRTGFLKAFSETPEPFTRGFDTLSKRLRALFLTRVALWPRYHVSVAESLEGNKKAEVVELEVPLTPAMSDIQNAIRECVDLCIQEVKKMNSTLGLDYDEWDVVKGGLESFDVVIRRQLEPYWHRLSIKTKRIVSDLAVLRNLLKYVLEYDSVSFLRHLDYIRETYVPDPSNTRAQESPWLFLDAAQVIFEAAKKRVYNATRLTTRNNDASNIDHLVPELEELPKWDVLADVLDEIDNALASEPPSTSDTSASVLIMVRSSETCRQLRTYLQTMHISPAESEGRPKPADELERSGQFMMRRKLRSYLADKRTFSANKKQLYQDNDKSINKAIDLTTGTVKSAAKAPTNRRRVRGGGVVGSQSRPSTEVETSVVEISVEDLPTAPPSPRFDYQPDLFTSADTETHYGLIPPSSTVILHAYDPDGDGDDILLDSLKPRYIIMYDVDAAFIRRIEVYRSSHPDRDVRSYFLYYGGSVEEEAYLAAVRKEKDAFTALIKARASMTLTLDVEKPPRAQGTSEDFLTAVNTRIAGGGKLTTTNVQPRVIVDIREFRSALPPLLHGIGLSVVPAQLTVGDFVLSPRICVERKAIPDLIQSLASGRLYSQCEAMTRHYAVAVLLIEFDIGKSFSLERFADMDHSSYASVNVGADLQGKIVALTIAFPHLRILWSSSPHETADIFQTLKTQESEPDPREAVEKGLYTGDREVEGGLEPLLQTMATSIPGITDHNLSIITRLAGSLRELANLELPELTKALGPQIAGRIHYFFNRNLAR